MSSPKFTDLFSGHAAQYAAARPRYPTALFQRIADAAPTTARVWDCGTGNGQAAVDLAEHFSHVDATDASADQIANAIAHPRVSYSVQPAEHTDLPAECFDVVTVATALHWFNLDAFFTELDRVLKPGGLFVAWSYLWPRVTPEIDAVFDETILARVEAYWAPEAELAKAGYTGIVLPYPEVELSSPPISARWDLNQMLALVYSWSATRSCMATECEVVMDEFEAALRTVWGDPADTHALEIPVMVRAARKPA